ncbi:MAG: hypothetical protein AUJ57_09600 [Zetaproteobacteria bacterium CG1_02_53_45]|nr:MAG: hypothetical protein AUJ57_09600 [Zetaproteobacteria bacterium CG1_02_53_45]
MRHSAACTWFLAALFALFGNIALLHAQESQQQYPETIAVLQMLYGGEVRAHYRYMEFSKVAKADGHTNIAHLFKAIAESEKVHERNFKRILKSIGAEPANVDLTSIKIQTTKENLKFATEVELAEIDTEYPRYIHRISPEQHHEALEFINYAWEAERQHRELIKEIQSGTGMFFNILLERFRTKTSTYYVNQNCGATVTELPLGNCPICHKPLDTYTVVPAP